MLSSPILVLHIWKHRMSHKPILLKNMSLSFPDRTCFEDFSIQLLSDQHIALIGDNGAGKSTLLKQLAGFKTPMMGDIICSPTLRRHYVPQLFESSDSISGGEQLKQALLQALEVQPDLLLLDEPTNHLDRTHREWLLEQLTHFTGTLIVATHDVNLLRTFFYTFWHIDNQHIHVFQGSYDDYCETRVQKGISIEREISLLKNTRKNLHLARMQEQQRSKKSREKGEKSITQRKWPTIRSHTKARRAEKTSGQKLGHIREKQEHLIEQLHTLTLPENISPTFSLPSSCDRGRTIISIHHGNIGYQHPIIAGLCFSCQNQDRIAILGDNGSGKSTFLKSLRGDPQIQRTGEWQLLPATKIAYLDQHYQTLDPEKTVLENIISYTTARSYHQQRQHLADFLFRTTAHVETKAKYLSGGEKARLCLAQMAAQTPSLLLLDEVTNNLDLTAREHIIQILQCYPGTLIVVSHDEDFLQRIGTTPFVLPNNPARSKS